MTDRSRALVAISLTAAAALPPAAAPAQVDPQRFTLDVKPVLRRYSPGPDGSVIATDAAGPVVIDAFDPDPAARTVRVELRYRITVTGSATGSYVGPHPSGQATYSSAGLANVNLDVTFSRPLPADALAPALAGSNLITNPGYANPDALDPKLGNYGLYSPWRTGPVTEGFGLINGTLEPSGIRTIVPISTSAPNQLSVQTLRSWSVYAFDFTVPLASEDLSPVTFSVQRSLAPDGTPANWLFFPRTTVNGSTSIQTGTLSRGPFEGGAVTVQIVPAPGAAAAALVAVPLAARRRRPRRN